MISSPCACSLRPHRAGQRVSSEARNRASRNQSLRHARTALVPVRGDEVPAGFQAQEAHQGGRAATETARSLYRRLGAETGAHGKLAGFDRQAAAGWRQDEELEHGARRRAQGLEYLLLRVDGSTRQIMAGSGTADQAVSGL